jgi:hypothetical protein
VADTKWIDSFAPVNSVDTPLSKTYAALLDFVYPVWTRVVLSIPYLVSRVGLQADLHRTKTYFDQPAASQVISDAIPEMYREMTIGRLDAGGFSGEERYVGGGRNLGLYVTAYNRNGRPLAGRVPQWSSSNATVASVTTAGRVTCEGPGTATITAANWQARVSFSYTCDVLPTDLLGTWTGGWWEPTSVRSGTATFVLSASGPYTVGTASWLGYTSQVGGLTIVSPGQASQAHLSGYDTECGELFKTMYGASYWSGCEFMLYVGVNSGGHLVGLLRGKPGKLQNFQDKDFDLVKP